MPNYQSLLSAGGFFARGLAGALGFGVSLVVAALALTFFLTTLGFLTTGAASDTAVAAAGFARLLVSATGESPGVFSAAARGLRGARGFFGAAASVEVAAVGAVLAVAEGATAGTFAAGAARGVGERVDAVAGDGAFATAVFSGLDDCTCGDGDDEAGAAVSTAVVLAALLAPSACALLLWLSPSPCGRGFLFWLRLRF